MRKLFYMNDSSQTIKSKIDRDKAVVEKFFNDGGTVAPDGNIYSADGNMVSTSVTANVEYMRYFLDDKTKQRTVPAILVKGYFLYGDIVFNKNVKCFYDYRDNNQFLLTNLMINILDK